MGKVSRSLPTAEVIRATRKYAYPDIDPALKPRQMSLRSERTTALKCAVQALGNARCEFTGATGRRCWSSGCCAAASSAELAT